MHEVSENLQLFIHFSRKIFERLLEHFPEPASLEEAFFRQGQAMVHDDAEGPSLERRVFFATLEWLEREGYIRPQYTYSNDRESCALTTKGLKAATALLVPKEEVLSFTALITQGESS